MLTSAGVGFGIGVLLTVAALPVFTVASPTRHHATPVVTLTPVAMSRAQVRARIRQLADGVLQLTALAKHRLESVTVIAVPSLRSHAPAPLPAYDVRITFMVNPSLFGTRFQVGSAESDCVLVLKALYTHDLPLRDIRLIGMVQFPNKPHQTRVLLAVSNPLVQSNLSPWKSLGQGDARRVWQSLQRHWLSKRYATYVFGKS